MTQTKRMLYAVLRNDLAAFTERLFREINPGSEYYPNWHIDTMAYHLKECAEGNITRLIITVPPRHLKSILASVALPAFILGNDPTRNVVCASYSEKLAGKHALDFRTVVGARWYQRLFRNMRADRRKNAELEFVTTQNGGRLATSVEGTLTGRGGDVIIIDDPIKPDEVMSEADRTRVNEWFNRTVYSRLNNKKDGVIIVVMQRLHEDDLVGHVRDLEDWTVVNIPAIAPEETAYSVGEREDQVYVRAAGELIDPRREGEEELDRIRHVLGSLNFSAQYQQNPLPIEGNLVQRRWLRTYDQAPDGDVLDAVVQSWDTAAAAGELNDYSVCTTWGVKGDRYYLLHVFREKLDYPALRRKAIELIRRYDADIVVVELAGTGQSLCQELRTTVDVCVRGLVPRGDKEVRLAAQSALIEQGRVLLPRQAPWLDAFIKEILSFPGGRHDDQVDSMELFLRFMRRPRGLDRRNGSTSRPAGDQRPSGRDRPQGHPFSSGSNAQRLTGRSLSLDGLASRMYRRKFGF